MNKNYSKKSDDMTEIRELITKAIDELNEQLEPDNRVTVSPDTRFIGSKASLDSISFVTFISILEELLEENYAKSFQLVDEKAFSEKNSPFYSVETLEKYIATLVDDK